MPALLPRNVLSLNQDVHSTREDTLWPSDPEILFSKRFLIHLNFTTKEIIRKKKSSPLP